jgi:DNA-binding YbaB/EbfC family protein
MQDMISLFRQAQVMKEKMSKFKDEMEHQFFTSSAGNGTVTVTINGKHEIQKVVIDPKALSDGDKLQEYLKTAINQAGDEVNKKLKEEVNKMTGGLGIPGLF